jgi:alpha-glucosidase
MLKRILLPVIFFIFLAGCTGKNEITISSPDRGINIILSPGLNDGSPGFKLQTADNKELLSSFISLKTVPGINLSDFRITDTEKKSVSGTWVNNFGEKQIVPDNYNQVTIFLQNGQVKINLIFRVYNEGAAFSYEFPSQGGNDSLTIIDEGIWFMFKADHYAWSAPRAQALYKRTPLSGIDTGCERPCVIEIDSSHFVALAEAGLVDYARMKFEPDSSSGIAIRSRLDGKVKRALPFRSPWRVIITGNDPGDLLEKNYMLLNLNEACALKDVSWIKPGKVLRESTLTTAGAEKAVDFVARHKMQYIEFDAGWYGYEYDDSSDARFVNVDPKRSKGPLDLPYIISYARSHDIGVILYVNRRALERQIDKLLPIYSKWGVSGLKFGFVQVGTQPVTSWMHEAIKKAADHKMIVDVHDEYRPTGFSRTYPNFLTQEGIRGDEESPSNSHTLITMFTRMIAGAGDNTVCYFDNRVDEKMGSHASQLAKAVCIFSPLQFLYWYDKCVPAGREADFAGKPNYLSDEPELEFFDNIPTVWDDTKVIESRIGEYGIIARRRGNDWFVGGINGSEARTLNICFNFLDPGRKYSATIYTDDPTLNTRTHVRTDTLEITKDFNYTARLGTNKGLAMQIVQVRD